MSDKLIKTKTGENDYSFQTAGQATLDDDILMMSEAMATNPEKIDVSYPNRDYGIRFLAIAECLAIVRQERHKLLFEGLIPLNVNQNRLNEYRSMVIMRMREHGLLEKDQEIEFGGQYGVDVIETKRQRFLNRAGALGFWIIVILGVLLLVSWLI